MWESPSLGLLCLRADLSTSKPSVSSCWRLAWGVIYRLICTRLSSMAVGRTLCISFSTTTLLIITSLPTPTAGRPCSCQMGFNYCREQQDCTDAHIKTSIISLQRLNKLAAQKKLLDNSILSTNLKVVIILNFMYAARYAGDFSTALKLSKNSKKDNITYIEFNNMVLLAILLLYLFTEVSSSLSNSLMQI